MSSLINKVKDALHSDKHSNEPETTQTTHTTHATHGSHPVNTTETAPSYATHSSAMGTNRGADGPALKTDGPHKSDMLNKADPRVDSDRDHSTNYGANPQGTATTGSQTTHTHNTRSAGGLTGTTGTHTTHNTGLTGTTGTHTTHNTGLTGTTGTHTTHNTGLTGTSGTHAVPDTTGHYNTMGTERGFDGSATRTDGPHNSNLLNKADPRVDSNRDYSRNLGANPHGTATTTTGSGVHSSHHVGGSGLQGENIAGFNEQQRVSAYGGGLQNENRGFDGSTTRTDGPHNSNLLNKADPRVDSDRDYSRNMGANPHGNATTTSRSTGQYESHGTTGLTGTTGQYESHGTTGFSGTTGQYENTGAHHTTSNTHGGIYDNTTTGNTMGGRTAAMHDVTGPAPNTAGPHGSDMMNKVDPRVDSDLDGSKTYGGNKTFGQQESSSLAHKDPTDAAQVPPSVLQKHIGAPTIEHGDHSHDRSARHSVSHQEGHRGL